MGTVGVLNVAVRGFGRRELEIDALHGECYYLRICNTS